MSGHGCHFRGILHGDIFMPKGAYNLLYGYLLDAENGFLILFMHDRLSYGLD
jgi:hypothetical protein